MNIGMVIQETWAFVNEIVDELENQHRLNQFETRAVTFPFYRERLNRALLKRDLSSFLAANQVVFFEWASELLAIATRLPKTCALVARLHRYEMYQWASQINWDAVDTIIVVSEAKCKEFNERVPGQAHKLVVIPESVNLDRFVPRSRAFQKDLGILGNLTPRKRVYELILAMADQGLAHEGYRLHIGGGEHVRFGDYYRALHELTGRLNLTESVTFHGLVQNAPEFYKNIDVFISNSYSEGLQVSPMEAMASGCYTLGHSWAGADELFPPENLYNTNSELAERIRTYASLPAPEQEARCAALRSRVEERFDARKVSVQVRRAIEAAAQEAAIPGMRR